MMWGCVPHDPADGATTFTQGNGFRLFGRKSLSASILLHPGHESWPRVSATDGRWHQLPMLTMLYQALTESSQTASDPGKAVKNSEEPERLCNLIISCHIRNFTSGGFSSTRTWFITGWRMMEAMAGLKTHDHSEMPSISCSDE